MLSDAATLPTLDTARLRLRWLTGADVPALFELFSDPEVTRYWSWTAYAEPAQARALVQAVHASFAARSLFQWGVELREGGELVGTCTLAELSAQHRRAALGFAVRHSHWGRGYGPETAGRTVEFGFTELDLHRLEADADPRNAGSLKVLEGLGFRREGLQRERYVLGDEIQDAALYGLLRAEWRAGRAAP